MKFDPLFPCSPVRLRLAFLLRFGLAVAAFGLTATSSLAAAEVVETDLCVYGGTSGGVIAAVQAARLGKTAVVTEFGNHLGGMTSGGLGFTDSGNSGAIGGLSREFYRRVGRHYGQGESFTFEPHVAEEAFQSMLRETKVPVYYGQRLASVTKVGQRITEITMENGNVFRARMFIDASYEGDLMAKAGVTYTFGREANSRFNESLNGVRTNTPAHQFAVDVDPYVIAGEPASGLLPFIQEGDGGVPGEGDQRIQAYNFRLCLTQSETNKMEITPPAGYDEAQYALLARYIEARMTAGQSMNLRSFLKIDAMPNGKTDINNNGAFSTDFIGQNYDYPDGSYARRAEIWDATLRYIQGLLYFLATDFRVPETVQNEMRTWGLCTDEFKDTGGWPHQLYVREARRMVSDYVITEHNCRGTIRAPSPIALASYTMDSHNCQRVVQNGVVRNEGDFQVGVSAPFPIGYASIVPQRGQCENLLVPFCLSASHVAFGSVRMEPVFMILGQSAATAAAFAMDDGTSVQDVPYAKLRLQLMADRQVLEWGGGSTPVSTNSVIVDSESTSNAVLTGSWNTSSSQAGYNGANYMHDNNTGKGTKSVRLTPNLPAAGNYTVHLRWTQNANRASNVPLTITYAGGVTNLTVNQRANGSIWYVLGTLPFEAGTAGNLLIENAGTDGFVVADAAMWLPVAEVPSPVVDVVGSDTVAGEDEFDAARFTLVRTGDTARSITVNYTMGGTAIPGEDYPQPAGTIQIPAGHTVAALSITPTADSLTEGNETVLFTLVPGSGYQLGSSTNAAAVVHDGGFGLWRGSRFSETELADTAVSGPNADPDNDRVSNLMEFFHGTLPKEPGAAPKLQLVPESGDWKLLWQRNPDAASLFVRLEISHDLVSWVPAPIGWQTPQIVQADPFETMRFSMGNPTRNAEPMFFRAAVSETPMVLMTNNAWFFFSFDAQPDGQGVATSGATVNSGFPGIPTIERFATATDANNAGGAASFTDLAGTNWLGSGSSTTPGHSLTFNPGSVGNEFNLTFSTAGLKNIRLRMDVRSAAQAGGSAPTGFSGFTYDIGGGPVPVPGANLAVVADNTFRPWTIDLSTLTVLENRPTVTLRWTFEDLGASPQESFRVDNIQVTASPR